MSGADASGSERAAADRGRLELLAAGALWSLGGVFIKSIALPAPAIASLRSLFAGLVMLPLVRRPPTRSLRLLLGSIACYAGVVTLFVYSTKVTTAANAIILQYTAPAWVFLLELVVHGRRPVRRDLWTLLGGMTGVAIIYLGAEPGDLLGVSLALASGVLFAAWMVLTARARGIDPVAMTMANNLGTAVLLAPLALSSGRPGAGQLLTLLVMGTVQLGIPYVLFSRGVSRVSASEASLIVLVEPVLNPIWVALVVDEVPGRATLTGGAVVLLTLAGRYAMPVLRAARRS